MLLKKVEFKYSTILGGSYRNASLSAEIPVHNEAG
jgi:hypothetical protein